MAVVLVGQRAGKAGLLPVLQPHRVAEFVHDGGECVIPQHRGVVIGRAEPGISADARTRWVVGIGGAGIAFLGQPDVGVAVLRAGQLREPHVGVLLDQVEGVERRGLLRRVERLERSAAGVFVVAHGIREAEGQLRRVPLLARQDVVAELEPVATDRADGKAGAAGVLVVGLQRVDLARRRPRLVVRAGRLGAGEATTALNVQVRVKLQGHDEFPPKNLDPRHSLPELPLNSPDEALKISLFAKAIPRDRTGLKQRSDQDLSNEMRRDMDRNTAKYGAALRSEPALTPARHATMMRRAPGRPRGRPEVLPMRAIAAALMVLGCQAAATTATPAAARGAVDLVRRHRHRAPALRRRRRTLGEEDRQHGPDRLDAGLDDRAAGALPAVAGGGRRTTSMSSTSTPSGPASWASISSTWRPMPPGARPIISPPSSPTTRSTAR